MTYTRMDRMSAEDALQLGGMPSAFPVDLLMSQLELLKNGDSYGAAVDRYTHSLQTATRCLRDGSDAETVVCALLHDIGDVLAPENHAELAASVLRPYVSEQNWWVVKHHDIFQGYYYFHYLGKDRKLRDHYRASPYFRACVKFCQRWDQLSFDPAYPTEPLDAFLPMVREVFGRKPRDHQDANGVRLPETRLRRTGFEDVAHTLASGGYPRVRWAHDFGHSSGRTWALFDCGKRTKGAMISGWRRKLACFHQSQDTD